MPKIYLRWNWSYFKYIKKKKQLKKSTKNNRIKTHDWFSFCQLANLWIDIVKRRVGIFFSVFNDYLALYVKKEEEILLYIVYRAL